MTVTNFASMGPFSARVELQNSATQNRYSRDDALGSTASYALTNAAATYVWEHGSARGMVFLRATNLADRKAFNTASFDTNTHLGTTAGPQRAGGVQVNF